MDKLKKLRAEIEKLLNGPVPSHDQQCDWSDGYWCALYKIDGILEELEKETEEPKEYQNALNSVAVTFLEEQGIIPNLYADQIIRAVKHGAAWQKQWDNGKI